MATDQHCEGIIPNTANSRLAVWFLLTILLLHYYKVGKSLSNCQIQRPSLCVNCLKPSRYGRWVGWSSSGGRLWCHLSIFLSPRNRCPILIVTVQTQEDEPKCTTIFLIVGHTLSTDTALAMRPNS